MQFAIISRRTTEGLTDDQVMPVVKKEIKAAKGFYQEGFIRQIWHRGDEPGAVLLLEADSLETAKEKLSALPMVKAGMLETEMIIPLTPYRGFAAD